MYGKTYKVKKRRSIFYSLLRIFGNKFFWLSFIVLFVSGGLVYFVFFSDFFTIEKINVSGAVKTSSEDIEEIVLAQGSNILLINLNKIKKQMLEDYPQIGEAFLERDFFHEISVKVKERTPAIIFCCGEFYSSDNCFFVDRDGVLFKKADQSDYLLVMSGRLDLDTYLGNKIFESDYISKILDIKSLLDKNEIKILQMVFISEKGLDVATKEGWYIHFNLKEDFDQQLDELGILLKEKIPFSKRNNLEYVDLRFEKIYIYPEIK